MRSMALPRLLESVDNGKAGGASGGKLTYSLRRCSVMILMDQPSFYRPLTRYRVINL